VRRTRSLSRTSGIGKQKSVTNGSDEDTMGRAELSSSNR